MEEQSREEVFEQYTRLVEEETLLLQKVQTCEECVWAVLGRLYKNNDTMHFLTVEDVLVCINNIEQELRATLLHLRLAKARLSSEHNQAGEENQPLKDEDI